MGKQWELDEILDRALQEEDPLRMDGILARLVAEERISRSAMLRRSAFAAAVGLTVLASPATALARGSATLAPPLRGKNNFNTILKEAKKEGAINTIALPPDWANYGEIMSTFQKRYGLKLTNDNPDASSAQENQAVRSLKGDSRAPDVLDVGPSFAIAGANEGLYAKYFHRFFGTVPRAMKDGRGYWSGDYWGVVSFGVNRAVVSTVPKTWADLLKPDYKNKVALNGSPLTSGSAVAGVFSAALANGGSLNNIGPGIDFFAQLKQVGNCVPVQATPQTIASRPDADRDRLGLPQPRVHQGVPGREDRRHDPLAGRLRGVLLPGDQRHRPAPVRRRGSGRSSSTPTWASCSGSRGSRTPRASPTWWGGRWCRRRSSTRCRRRASTPR